MSTDHVTAAISKLSAVPAALLFQRRLGITHVYQAAECGGRWYGADDAELARLGAALESGQPDAYSHWCTEVTSPEVPFLVTDHGGDETTYHVRMMADAIGEAVRWVDLHHADGARILIVAPNGDVEMRWVAPDGEEEIVDVDPA